MAKKKPRAADRKGRSVPNLKSASGSPFTFEDKVAALLFCEMLAGHASLGGNWGIAERIERQANDWEPFGDLLITAAGRKGVAVQCGCSIKSNRQITANGCKAELNAQLWSMVSKPEFNQSNNLLGLFCATLSSDVSRLVNQFCKQAREEPDPQRLDQKITHANHRKIYESFLNPSGSSDQRFPGHVLERFIPREFDFDRLASRDEETAIALCRGILQQEDATPEKSRALWEKLLSLARELRDSGGAVTRERLIAKLRDGFRLRDDPCDVPAWALLRARTQEWKDQIGSTLPRGLVLPRFAELDALRKTVLANSAFHVIGDSGSGKSALLKALARETTASASAEVVWIKGDQFAALLDEVPGFVEVLRRSCARSGLLLFDSLEACNNDILDRVAKSVAVLCADPPSPWRIVLVCQTPEWSRVSRLLAKNIGGHGITKRFECGDLSAEDMQLVYAASASIRRLASQPRLRRVLASPKMLDLLLSGQIQEDRLFAGEADLVDWWWHEQVQGGRQFAGEETIVRKLAAHMANDLTSEATPDAAEGPAEAVEFLIKRRVLRRTSDGRLRFDHDLLADWARVMHLRSLGGGVLAAMRTHVENPPWLRAIRLLSQHLLERASDLARWRALVEECGRRPEAGKEPAAVDLQVLDALLEGIVHCADAQHVLESLRTDLFAHDAWLFKRLIRRLMHSGTFPDPVIQDQIRRMDASAAEEAALQFRLPRSVLWQPVFDLMVAYPNDTTEFLPVELAECGAIWARLQDYLQRTWSPVADLLILNAEKELRREVAGEYRHERSSLSVGGGHESRVKIYTAALAAAAHSPDRAAKLVLKACGRTDWDEGDVPSDAGRAWRGEVDISRFNPYQFDGRYIKQPPESWPDGPKRRVSADFSHAWFEFNATLPLYRIRPADACEVTLAFLIDWPRAEIRRGQHDAGIDRHGFRSDTDQMKPPIWTQGPFLSFLREDWRPALDLIIRLTNFATDRYEEWWPYEPGVVELHIAPNDADVRWKGNHQIYAWSRSAWNTPGVVTCALMSLEKWLEEQVVAAKQITEAVLQLYRNGRSLAFGGLLISIGKRHPDLFMHELKPLLFVRDLYTYDLQSIKQYWEPGFWPGEGSFNRKLRHDWAELPGRRIPLYAACRQWLLEKPEMQPVLNEVSNAWRQEAENLPSESPERLVVLRWAADFDRTLYMECTLPDGEKGWRFEIPAELEDLKGAERLCRIQDLITLPSRCADLLERGYQLSAEEFESIWLQLHNWTPFEQLVAGEGEDGKTIELRDHRNARAGLLAVLLCAGETWLTKCPGRREWLENEVRTILAEPPEVTFYGPNDIHDDYESLLARAIVRCWAHSPKDVDWRGHVASFVTAYRYRTVLLLFQEAFRIRINLGTGYRELEAFALSYAVARKKATQVLLFGTRQKTDAEVLRKWGDEWLSKFAHGSGPKWAADWSKIEVLVPFPHQYQQSGAKNQPPEKLRRRDYGIDMGIVLAAFAHFPSLVQAADPDERLHWLSACQELLASFCRTLPSAGNSDAITEWHYDHWDADREVFEVVARRIFECTEAERRELWRPIVTLPLAAYHHINEFLNTVLIEPLRKDPPEIGKLIPIWREIVDCIFASPHLPAARSQERSDILKNVLLYGSTAASSGEEYWLPLVKDLRPRFKDYCVDLGEDGYEQRSIGCFLTTKAGEDLLVDALVWLHPSWERASDYFWNIVTEDEHFPRLLEHAWRTMFDGIRKSPDALKAFKTLTLKLAAHHIPIAMEIQQNVGA